jgi:hypothetical protein
MKKVNLAEQLNAFASGRIIDSEGLAKMTCFNFYDWFCKDSSLERKANVLFPKVKQFPCSNFRDRHPRARMCSLKIIVR